ncbi:N-acetylglucosamine kinase [Agromyces sp. NPDC058110]|uniref:N-acetylglucosamine kinase n=1 Tax=Agromyces sp. NPDC058110 TaxID=3346345 RepID=UPI0036DCCD02
MTGSVLAIDAGQTGIKTRFADASGAVSETVLPGIRTHEPVLVQLAETAARIAAASAGASRSSFDGDARADGGAARIEVLAAGVSGLTEAEADADALLTAVRPFGVRRVLLVHDSISSFIGALGDARGAVIAAGTGSVTLGVGRDAVRRVDGWGNIMGDAGSGYWIGREALDAGMRGYDGRGPATALTGLIAERWPDIEQAYIDLQVDPNRVGVVASFAERVAALATTDEVAADICRRAADELAGSVLAALRSVGEAGAGASPRLSAIGGVFRADRIRSRFERQVRLAVPGVDINEPQGSGLDGAAALPHLDDAHPLHAHVTVASLEQPAAR